jgi:Rho GTPase-activating protein 12/27
MENLIDNANILFDDRLLPSSPPLPPAPTGEPVPVISFGSSHTKVALPPLPPQSGEAPSVDFTPQLPARPAGSIHPSTRSNPPMSPSRLSADPSALAQSIPPAALLPRIQTTMDAAEQSARESLVSDTSTLVERAPVPAQDSVPPPTVTRERYQGEHQLEAESSPETPLTASSLASSNLNFSH